MSAYIAKKLRFEVIKRASDICEYCLIAESISFIEFHIDHIISLKHGGDSMEANLAYCCSRCNFNKGSDLGSILENKENLIRFFNPRKDNWFEHFEIKEGYLLGKTDIGKVTVKIFQFNTPQRVKERKPFIQMNLFPHPNTPNLPSKEI